MGTLCLQDREPFCFCLQPSIGPGVPPAKGRVQLASVSLGSVRLLSAQNMPLSGVLAETTARRHIPPKMKRLKGHTTTTPETET